MSQNADESDLKEDYPSQLRDSLRCQILLKLVLQLPRLMVIPCTVFEHMPLLEVLDLSSTSIQSLPSSISSLSSLKELLLRDCSFLIELPIEIGMLTKLTLLDIEGSEIMYIPKEIVELTDLEVLRLCLSRYAEYYIKAKNVNGGVKVPRMMISKLKKLKELCINVCQEAEWWEKEIKEIQDEICHLENLEFLKWYLPTDTTLKQFLGIQINRKPAYEKLSNFTFTIGQHAQLTSCLPRGLEKKFTEFENCLKWINAEGNIYDISKIMTRAKALFLSRHWTIVNLSAFDISKLKYFLLAECNEMETLVKIDDLSEIVENNKKSGLESLEYLSLHYMEKLKSIWEGPVGKDSLSRLRILALHTCLELTTIFTPRIAQNLSCLAELTVEECPKVRSLIINPHSEHGPLFPSLERIFLIDLPELDHIFGGLIVLEKLESLMIYNCVKLRRLSEMELPRIQKIKGENKWWNSLTAYEPTWENVFEPLKENSELIKQLLEATNSLQHFHDVVSREAKDEKPLDGPVMGAQETKIEPFNFPLRKEEGRFHTLPVDDLLTEASESSANGLSMLSTSRSEVHQESEVFKRNSEKTPTQGQSFSPNANLSRNNEKTPLVLVKQGRERKSRDTRVEVSNTTEDCYQWRKYGEKEILNSKFPRCYYRCTHMNNQGCEAKKHVQQLEDESNKFRITYSGYHTCSTPHNYLIVPHHGPEVVLSFEGSKNQQSLTTNNSTTKKIGDKPS